jgi:hypothetical protein
MARSHGRSLKGLSLTAGPGSLTLGGMKQFLVLLAWLPLWPFVILKVAAIVAAFTLLILAMSPYFLGEALVRLIYRGVVRPKAPGASTPSPRAGSSPSADPPR